MSIRDRRAKRPGPARSLELPWIVLVLAAALIGGLAAAALVHASLIMAVVVSVVAAAIAVLALRMASAQPRGQATYGSAPVSPPPGAPADANPPPAAPVPPAPVPPAPVPAAAAPAAPPAPVGSAVQMLPLPPQPGEEAPSADVPWWDPAPGRTPRPGAGANRVPAPDLTTYLASTFIAQCPRCGDFRLDIGQARDTWDFRCEACEYTWVWRPGTAWPPVRVTPGLRRESHPPAS